MSQHSLSDVPSLREFLFEYWKEHDIKQWRFNFSIIINLFKRISPYGNMSSNPLKHHKYFNINASFTRQVSGLKKIPTVEFTLWINYVAVKQNQIKKTIYKELFDHERAETSVLHFKMNLIL